MLNSPILRYCAIALPLVLSGCDDADSKASASKPLELKATSEFTTSMRPAQNPEQVVSQILMASGMALEGEEVEKQPRYIDLEFFPITDSDAFKSMQNPYMRRRDRLPDLSGIDFDKQFAFMVAHPEGSAHDQLSTDSQAMFFTTVTVSYPEDKIVLGLKARRLGEMSLVSMMSGQWAGEIYTIDKKNHEALEVHMDDETYEYSLAKAETQETSGASASKANAGNEVQDDSRAEAKPEAQTAESRSAS